MDLLDSLILYDETSPGPSMSEIIIWTGVILVVSNLIFIVLCAIVGIDPNKTLDTEKDKEYQKWYANNVSPWTVGISEVLGSTIYSPVAEELAFRFLLLKVVCIRELKMNFWAANTLQAVIFGFMHVSNMSFTTQTKKYTYLQSFSAAISGIVSGFVYKQSNSILPSLFAHMINNGAAGASELFGYLSYRALARPMTPA
jgi:membrane protease YdiL (CAAX protease family)